jgi:hypothetical protein
MNCRDPLAYENTMPTHALSLQLKRLRQEQLRLEEEVTEKAKVSE